MVAAVSVALALAAAPASAAPPTVVGFGPASVPAGMSVTVFGSNLNPPVTVTLGGNVLVPSPSGSSNYLSFVVPSGAQSGPLTISAAGGTVTTSATLTVPFTHYPFFAGETALSNGVYYLALPDGNPFGYYSYLADQNNAQNYIYHVDLGYEYTFDAADGNGGVYLYDFASQGFFYTSPAFPFPYLYDFTLDSVVYYYPDPNNPGRYNTNGVRYFYVFSTAEIISK